MKRHFFLIILFCYQSIKAQDKITFLRDANANYTIDSLLKKNESFSLVTNPSFGHDHVPYWFKISVKNKSNKLQKKFIEVDYAYLDEVSIFVVKNAKLVYRSPTIGWQTSYKNRPVKHYNPIFPVAIQPQSEQIIYLKALRKTLLFVAPVKMWNEYEFYENEITRKFFWGGFSGILLFIFFFGIILFISLKQNTYLYYSLYVFTSLFYVFLNKGMFLEYYQAGIWRISGTNIRQSFLNLQSVFILLFIREYLFHNFKFPKIISSVFKTCIIFNIVAVPLLGYEKYYSYLPFVVFLYPISFITTILFSFYLVFYNLHKKIAVKESRIYIIGITPLVLLSVFSLIRNYGIIDNHWLLEIEGMMLCFLFEILVLSIGLGIRYKKLRDEKEVQQKLVFEGQLKLLHEKESISRDLHDNVGSQLSVISSSLDNMGYLSEKQKLTTASIETVSEFVREAIQSLRDTIWATHQGLIPLPEFRARVQQYILKYYQSLENCKIDVSFEESNYTFTSSQALNLFRIIQEALNNAIKHAQASFIHINLFVINNKVTIKIIDNGIGFDLENNTSELHYGLLNMQKRVNEIEGKLEIISKPNDGTIIILTI